MPLQWIYANVVLVYRHNADQINLVPIIVTEFPNTYVYEARTLYLAYGISYLFATTSCLIGLHALVQNGGESFSNKFSTVLRTMRDLGVSDVVEDHDRGSDPLPEKIAETSVTLNLRRA